MDRTLLKRHHRRSRHAWQPPRSAAATGSVTSSTSTSPPENRAEPNNAPHRVASHCAGAGNGSEGLRRPVAVRPGHEHTGEAQQCESRSTQPGDLPEPVHQAVYQPIREPSQRHRRNSAGAGRRRGRSAAYHNPRDGWDWRAWRLDIG
jgi:hypothetical protein